jgi:hypothetical protein
MKERDVWSGKLTVYVCVKVEQVFSVYQITLQWENRSQLPLRDLDIYFFVIFGALKRLQCVCVGPVENTCTCYRGTKIWLFFGY